MLTPDANGYLIAIAFFMGCCWVNPNEAVPYRTRLQAIDQVDQRVDNRPETTTVNVAHRAIDQPDSGTDKKPTLSGGGKKWRFPQHPRSPRSRIKNINTNVNINTFGQSHKVDQRVAASPIFDNPKANMDPLTLETVNCSEPHNANDRYSSSFSGNGSARALNVGDDFRVAGEAGTKKTSSVHVGEDITLCWIETTTIKEDRSMNPIQRLVIREYTISFENSATIPERYLECVKLEGEVDWKDNSVPKSALFEVMDENTRHSRVVNFTTVSHSDDLTVWQHRRVRCGVGPVVTKNIIEWADEHSDNPKKRVEIKVSPRIHRLSAHPTDTEPCTTDVVESQPTSTTPRHPVLPQECGPGTTCDSYSDCVDDSCGNFSSSNESYGDSVPQTESTKVYTTVSSTVGTDSPVTTTTQKGDESELNDILSTSVTKGTSPVTDDAIDLFLETTTPGLIATGTMQSKITTDVTSGESWTTSSDRNVPTTTESSTLLSVTLAYENESDSIQTGDHKVEPPSESDESYFNTNESKDSTESCESGESCAKPESSDESFFYSSEEGTTAETEMTDSASHKDSTATDTEEFTTAHTTGTSFISKNAETTAAYEEDYSSEEEWTTTVKTPQYIGETGTMMPTEITKTSTMIAQSPESGTAITAPTQGNDATTETTVDDTTFTRSPESSTTTTEMMSNHVSRIEQMENISDATITEPTVINNYFTESMENVDTMTQSTKDVTKFTGWTEGGETTTQTMKGETISTGSSQGSDIVTEATRGETTTIEATQGRSTVTETNNSDDIITTSTDSVIETIAVMPKDSTTTTEALKSSVGYTQSTECDPSSGYCEIPTGTTTDNVKVQLSEDSDSSTAPNDVGKTPFSIIDSATSKTRINETAENMTSTVGRSDRTMTESDVRVLSRTEVSATETNAIHNETTFGTTDFTSEMSSRTKPVIDLKTLTEEQIKNISIPVHSLENECENNSTTCTATSDELPATTELRDIERSKIPETTEETFSGPESSSIGNEANGEFTTTVAGKTMKPTIGEEKTKQTSTIGYYRENALDTSPTTNQPSINAIASDSVEETSVQVLTTTDMPGHETATETISSSQTTERNEDIYEYTGDGVTNVVPTQPSDEDIFPHTLEDASPDATTETVTVGGTGEPMIGYSTTPDTVTIGYTEELDIESSTPLGTVTVGGTEEPIMDSSTTPRSVTIGGTEEPIDVYSTTLSTFTDGGTDEPALEYSTTPSTEMEGTTKKSDDWPTETTPHPCDPDTESCESKEESTDSLCDEETASCTDISLSTRPCDEESASCSTDASMSISVSTCSEELSDCSFGTTSVSTDICDENSRASCVSTGDPERYSTSADSSEVCENSPTGTCTMTPQTRENSNNLTTTSSTPIGVENVSTTVSDVPTTVESRRSTTAKAVSTDSTFKHKLALKIKILLEHIDENKKRLKLVEVEKHLLFNEHPDEHETHSLMKQVRSLNNSVNMRTVQALFNCSTVEKLTGDVGEFAAKYLAAHTGLRNVEEPVGNVSETVEPHVRKPRDLNPSAKSEVDSNLEMSLPGIHSDIHAGFDHVLSRLPSEHEVKKRSAEVIEEEIPRSRIFEVVADPQDERVYTRKKKQTIEDLTIDQEDLPEDVQEVGHWSNERVRRSTNGSHFRTLTEFTIYKGP